ncbi:MFS transporter [Streptoalloteichus hindustanus]|uniref:Predicted arabinose efflux permease, MFS family n=1 Tax=Streptoalloteichus hindustanus TaxID=2017 RepID=A0A1M5MQ51_STRHI|nr:MFS transporter [Streptoalloteichus hindustanus]SHG79524.1 Predicted arabinose efflux permease, MFS family [Streptoalloteichus hindustanus]
MKGIIAQARSHERSVQLLLVNQFTINLGFYMLMPYLADHLSVGLGMAGWLVGLVLGVRNLSQQGMFLVGGSLADRLGYKPLIVTGCALRTAGFGLLAIVDTLPTLVLASAATGFAGALFNPAVRAYVAHDAGERRVEAFALFNTAYQAGILVGPLVGVVLTGVGFRLTAATAALVFAALTVLQARALPSRRATPAEDQKSMIRDWRAVLGNRPFLLFSLVMIGSYVLSFQVYLALPLEIRRLASGTDAGNAGVAVLFALSGLLAILTQVRLAAWCKQRLRHARAMRLGLTLMAAAFAPPACAALIDPAPAAGWLAQALAFTPIVLSGLLLTLGTIVLYPFEMDTIVTMSEGRLVATHYGLYSTLSGIGITLGNLGTGASLDLARDLGTPGLPWLALTLLGAICVLAMTLLDKSGHLTRPPTPAPTT